MGIITLGIGPVAPHLTFFVTSGLRVGAAAAVVPIFEADVAIRLTATRDIAVRLTASSDARIEH
jgi:hypothetical protein